MIVLDTNVVSALMLARPDAVVAAWLDEQPAESIWITSVTTFEVRLGLARLAAGRKRRALETAFDQMVRHQFTLIFDEVERRWPVESVRLVHRIGVVAVGEPSLWVEVVTAHRAEAFAACQWLIDEMKRTVPIWKRPV